MERDLIKMRWFALRKYKLGLSGNDIARELLMPRRTIYGWIAKYSNCNKEELRNEITREKMAVDPKTRAYIIKLRERYDWGPVRIEGYIRTNKPDGIAPLGHNKIYAILVEEKLNMPLDFTRKTWGTKRFERDHSNTLWQTDFKLLDNDNWLASYLDDHSRFIVISKEFSESPTTEIALEILKKAGKKYGFPEQILTDQGSQYYCADKENKKQGISEYTSTLNELGIQHIVASKRRPTTIGKIESFHRAVQYECYLFDFNVKKFVNYWNYKRPHQSLKYKFPADVYFADFKKRTSASNQG